jgi:hypothetical protein
MAFTCGQYQDFLFDRTPHFDEDILKDWFPTDDAWVGHVATGTWDAFTGVEHTYDRIHVSFPDMSGCWQEVGHDACVGAPCAPPEKCVAWGSTRKTYGKERQSYTTIPLCFDQIDSKAKAKEQFSQIVSGLKKMTKMIWSNWFRTWALRGAGTLHIAGSAKIEVTLDDAAFGTVNNCNQLDVGGVGNLPTSKLVMGYLDGFYEALQFEGYFNSQIVPSGMFKLITDAITARELREMNPVLNSRFQFSDFVKGGAMYKFGVTEVVGNYGISLDAFPIRFNHIGNGVLQRVYPYTNTQATIGIRPQVAQEYLVAPYQISEIWHAEAMRALFAKLESVHPDMPFLVRDLAGKWRFTGPETDVLMFRGTDGTQCTVDNKRRNQGIWWADFEAGIRYDRPELVRLILHKREPACMVDQPPCADDPDYVIQDNGSCVEMCEEEYSVYLPS